MLKHNQGNRDVDVRRSREKFIEQKKIEVAAAKILQSLSREIQMRSADVYAYVSLEHGG